jgi:hypothetical protein
MPTEGMRSTPELTRGWLLTLRASVVVFVVAAVVLAVQASRGAGSGAWAASAAFVVAAIGQGAGLVMRRRREAPRAGDDAAGPRQGRV